MIGRLLDLILVGAVVLAAIGVGLILIARVIAAVTQRNRYL